MPGRGRRGEHGQALPLVIIMVTFFAVIVVVVLDLSGSVGRNTKRDNSHDTALSVAEAGVANALAVLANAPRPLDPAALPSSSSPQVDTIEGKVVSWYGSLSGDTWTITSQGSAANPSGGGTLNRIVHVDARVGSTAMNPAWNYIFGTAGGCLSFTGTADVKEPVYASGNLCLDGTAKVTGSSVVVAGHIDMGSTASIGAVGAPINALHVANGCSLAGGPYASPCTPSENVFASAQDAVVPAVHKPPLELDFWYANAKPGPTTACDAPGTFPGGFDNDTTMNRSLPDVDLFASNYDCRVVVGGTQVGRIAYIAGTPGTLAIDGTVFVDGNIVLDGSQEVVYSGRGTIYASGTIELAGSQKLCASWSGGCDPAGWDPETNMLVLVSGSTSDDPSFTAGGTTEFQGGIYAAGNYAQAGTAQVQGPKLGETVTIAGTSQATFPAYASLPPGAPMDKPVVTTNGWR